MMNLLVSILLMALPHYAMAEETPIIFARSILTILPTAPEKLLEKEALPEKQSTITPPENTPVKPPRTTYSFTVEVIPYSALSTEGMFTQGITDQAKGALYVLPQESRLSIQGANIITPVDVLLIRADGTIANIIPSLNLSELEQAVESTVPIKAVLHLANGTVKKLDIRPLDTVEHASFTKHPEIMQ